MEPLSEASWKYFIACSLACPRTQQFHSWECRGKNISNRFTSIWIREMLVAAVKTTGWMMKSSTYGSEHFLSWTVISRSTLEMRTPVPPLLAGCSQEKPVQKRGKQYGRGGSWANPWFQRHVTLASSDGECCGLHGATVQSVLTRGGAHQSVRGCPQRW